ncbi:mannitol-1-phosphate 5-dehydrogenase [Cohnella zeiphila]|uniref:Mannitol-1-phosphate 5-dehydrogenase n=1 Tax=Cohnella zeiphila TaxID=2761120 RepID=A0A7X0VV52_9BACL|nr:mannitol-1-phosphate 5-dehydrogenase [Cohnella zeiphila]MBB6731769.1 mannitol-1-phosphate 5-dehydrogenase [Cohnella zeiphila]
MPGKRAVHFGAGNIGRGFIGWMLYRSGYEVTFVSRNDKQIELMRDRGQYTVTLASEAEEREIVRNVTAIHIGNAAAVRESMLEADLVTTSVGEAALAHIAKALADGLAYRLRRHSRPLQIVACENAVHGSAKLKGWVYSHLPDELRERAERCAAFPNAIVDRIVPPQPSDELWNVRVEPFHEWVLEQAGGTDPIEGVRYVTSLEPYAERKLYTVNVGHCGAAYFGYLAGYRTIPESLRDERLRNRVAGAMEETGRLLVRKYGWSEEEHRQYIRKSLQRFANPRIPDKVARVGRSPLRKLAPDDRLIRPALQASALGMDSPHLVTLISAALLFDHGRDPEAVKLQARIRARGVRDVIRSHMGILEHHPLHFRIANRYEELKRESTGIS